MKKINVLVVISLDCYDHSWFFKGKKWSCKEKHSKSLKAWNYQIIWSNLDCKKIIISHSKIEICMVNTLYTNE